MKNKLAMFDMDGTLFDTKDVNYHAYSKALNEFGYSIDYEFYCKECNGRLYKQFLPEIIGNNEQVMEKIHDLKKIYYSEFLDKAIVNEHLFDIIKSLSNDHYIALVTTASKKNTMDILTKFNKEICFDLILTHNDISKSKPDPEGFLLAMKHFNVEAKDCLIFEDSKPGIEAARKSGATVFVTLGFNE